MGAAGASPKAKLLALEALAQNLKEKDEIQLGIQEAQRQGGVSQARLLAGIAKAKDEMDKEAEAKGQAAPGVEELFPTPQIGAGAPVGPSGGNILPAGVNPAAAASGGAQAQILANQGGGAQQGGTLGGGAPGVQPTITSQRITEGQREIPGRFRSRTVPTAQRTTDVRENVLSAGDAAQLQIQREGLEFRKQVALTEQARNDQAQRADTLFKAIGEFPNQPSVALGIQAAMHEDNPVKAMELAKTALAAGKSKSGADVARIEAATRASEAGTAASVAQIGLARQRANLEGEKFDLEREKFEADKKLLAVQTRNQEALTEKNELELGQLRQRLGKVDGSVTTYGKAFNSSARNPALMDDGKHESRGAQMRVAIASTIGEDGKLAPGHGFTLTSVANQKIHDKEILTLPSGTGWWGAASDIGGGITPIPAPEFMAVIAMADPENFPNVYDKKVSPKQRQAARNVLFKMGYGSEEDGEFVYGNDNPSFNAVVQWTMKNLASASKTTFMKGETDRVFNGEEGRTRLRALGLILRGPPKE